MKNLLPSPSRRQLLQYATAASALAATGAIPSIVQSAFADVTATPAPLPWRNWSGGQSCQPAMRAAPANETALAELITGAKTPVRAVGAGHSFSPLVPTEGTLLTLDRISGVTTHDPETHQADVLAGTRLAQMSDELAKRGLAFDNMPDINKQSLAGAVSTSTHGTGAEIGSLSTFLRSLRLVTASGDVIECDAKTKPEIYQAARVSMGALGIITKARVQARPLYKLKRRTWVAPVEEMLDALPELETKNRNFEFYYIPYSGMALGISNNETDEPETPVPVNEDDDGLRQLKMLEDWLGWSPPIRRWTIQKILGGMEPEERVDYSHKTLSTTRGVRFNEMEYHLPREAAPGALREIIETIEKTTSRSSSRSKSAPPRPTTSGSAPFTAARALRSPSINFMNGTTNPISKPSNRSSANIRAARIGASSTRWSRRILRASTPSGMIFWKCGRHSTQPASSSTPI